MSFSGIKGYLTKPKPGVQINPLHPLSSGLVGYWLFNEGSGSRAYDISGHGNHGTLKNMSPNAQNSGWGGSKFGGGLEFDGVDDYVDCGNGGSLTPTQAITISFWLKYNALPIALHRIIHKENTAPSSYSIYSWSGDNAICFTINGADTLSTDTTVWGTNWHNLVFTYDKQNIKVYVDGALDATPLVYTSDIVTNTGSLSIGGTSSGSVVTNGSIDSARIYNRALSEIEIKQLYHHPFCNLLQVPIRRYSVAAPPVGAIMNQFQRANIGADLYNGVFA